MDSVHSANADSYRDDGDLVDISYTQNRLKVVLFRQTRIFEHLHWSSGFLWSAKQTFV